MAGIKELDRVDDLICVDSKKDNDISRLLFCESMKEDFGYLDDYTVYTIDNRPLFIRIIDFLFGV